MNNPQYKKELSVPLQVPTKLSDDNLKKKIKALKHYKSQINKSINLEWVESLSKVYVTKTWARNTEAFAINHMLKKIKND